MCLLYFFLTAHRIAINCDEKKQQQLAEATPAVAMGCPPKNLSPEPESEKIFEEKNSQTDGLTTRIHNITHT